MFKDLTIELDRIAGTLQKRGGSDNVRIATAIDAVSNSLDTLGKSASGGRRAISNNEMVFKGTGEPPPGSDDAMEYEHEDSFVADPSTYQRVPLGAQSMGEFVGAPSPDKINLDIAEEGPVFIQARRQAPRQPRQARNIRFFANSGRSAAESAAGDLKEYSDEIGTIGDALDPFTTSGMEPEQDAVDANQKGQTLEFYENDLPAGSLHMPKKGGPGLSARAQTARRVLRKAVVEVQDPKQAAHDDDSMNHIPSDTGYMGAKGGGVSDLHHDIGSSEQNVIQAGQSNIDDEVQGHFDTDVGETHRGLTDVISEDDGGAEMTDEVASVASSRRASRNPLRKIRFRQ